MVSLVDSFHRENDLIPGSMNLLLKFGIPVDDFCIVESVSSQSSRD